MDMFAFVNVNVNISLLLITPLVVSNVRVDLLSTTLKLEYESRLFINPVLTPEILNGTKVLFSIFVVTKLIIKELPSLIL